MSTLPNWRNTVRLPPLQVNPTTKRFARNLDQAFGAGTSREIAPETIGWRLVDAICPAGLGIAVLLVLAGVL